MSGYAAVQEMSRPSGLVVALMARPGTTIGTNPDQGLSTAGAAKAAPAVPPVCAALPPAATPVTSPPSPATLPLAPPPVLSLAPPLTPLLAVMPLPQAPSLALSPAPLLVASLRSVVRGAWSARIVSRKNSKMPAMPRLYIPSSATARASPSQPCFSRVGQSVGTYAATLLICDALTMSRMPPRVCAPGPSNSMCAVSSTGGAVHTASMLSSAASKVTPSLASTMTCWNPCHVNWVRSDGLEG